jgi:hypothetical protein
VTSPETILTKAVHAHYKRFVKEMLTGYPGLEYSIYPNKWLKITISHRYDRDKFTLIRFTSDHIQLTKFVNSRAIVILLAWEDSDLFIKIEDWIQEWIANPTE